VERNRYTFGMLQKGLNLFLILMEKKLGVSVAKGQRKYLRINVYLSLFSGKKLN
jgi:hypothetical protein